MKRKRKEKREKRMPITLEEAKQLKTGQILYHRSLRNADEGPQRWKVNGMVKTWKRSPDEIRVPIKRGLYEFDYLTEADVADKIFYLTEEEALEK